MLWYFSGQTLAKLDALVNSTAEQMVSPLHTVNPNSVHLAEHEAIGSSQQTRTSPQIPVKTMLLEALIPTQSVQPLTAATGAASVSPATTVEQTGESLLTTINAALQLPEAQVSAATATPNTTVNIAYLRTFEKSTREIRLE